MCVNPMPSTASAYAWMATGSFPISVCGSTTPIFMKASSRWAAPRAASAASRDDAGGQRLDVGADVARPRQPHAITVLADVLERAAQPADAVRPTGDERVERDRAHQRLAGRLGEHLVELVDDQIRELVARVAIPDDPARVVHLDRIRHGENPALARANPERPVG